MISQASPGNLQQVEEFLFSSTRMDSAPVVIAVNYGVSNDQKVYIIISKKKRETRELKRVYRLWVFPLQIQLLISWVSVNLLIMTLFQTWR